MASKGTQELGQSAGDCGGKSAYQKASGPASSKQGVSEKVPYKHR